MANGNTNFGNSAGTGTVGADGFNGPVTGNVTGTVTTAAQQVVAAGSNSQSAATVVVPGIVIVTTVSATTRGIRLSVKATNSRYEVYNNAATAMDVYPATNAAIDAIATNTKYQIVGRKGAIFTYRSGTLVASIKGA